MDTSSHKLSSPSEWKVYHLGNTSHARTTLLTAPGKKKPIRWKQTHAVCEIETACKISQSITDVKTFSIICCSHGRSCRESSDTVSTFHTAECKTSGCADQCFRFMWRVSVIERNLQRIILRLSCSLRLCGVFKDLLTHCFGLMTYNFTVVVYSHHFYTTLLQDAAASRQSRCTQAAHRNYKPTSWSSSILVLCLQGGLEKPFQRQSDHVADTLVLTG